MTVTAITSLAQFRQIINSGKYVIIDFWATWCGPCRVISPIFERFSTTFTGVEYYKVDVDAQPEVVQEVGIRAMPTFILFKNGQRVRDLIGANPKALEDLVKLANA